MTCPGASPGEMPKTPVPGQAGPELDEQLLDAILAGQHLSPDAPEQAHVLAEMLASLAGPADPGDLTAEPAMRSAFARTASSAARRGPASPAVPAGPTPPGRDQPGELPEDGRQPDRRQPERRRPRLPIRLSARLGAALAAVLVMLGGTVAAYAGVLPGPIQNLAHRAIDAPPARTSLTGPAMCVAYDRAEARHDAPALAGAFVRLAKAAGGASRVIPYCIEAGKPLTATRPIDQPDPPASPNVTGPGQRHAHGRGHAKGHHPAKKKAKKHLAKKKAKKLKKAKKAKAKKAKKAKAKAKKAKAKKRKKAKKHHRHKHHGQAKGHHKHKKHKHKKAQQQKV